MLLVLLLLAMVPLEAVLQSLFFLLPLLFISLLALNVVTLSTLHALSGVAPAPDPFAH